jgi:hypothetical protein
MMGGLPPAAAATAASATAAAASAATTTATATAAATTAEATAATAATALRALFGFVHAEGATVEAYAVHRGDRVGRLVRVAHGHEAEAARLAALTIGHDVDVGHVTRRGESRAKRLRRGAERKVANVKSIAHDSSLLSIGPCKCLPSE